MRSKFNESLPILHGPADQRGVRLGVCAMGPVGDGDKLTSMRVWVFQETGAKAAAASGTGGRHLGGHPMSDNEKPPFTTAKGWMVQTELEPGSDQFVQAKPALAMAMALVTHKDGTDGVEHWTQAVLIG